MLLFSWCWRVNASNTALFWAYTQTRRGSGGVFLLSHYVFWGISMDLDTDAVLSLLISNNIHHAYPWLTMLRRIQKTTKTHTKSHVWTRPNESYFALRGILIWTKTESLPGLPIWKREGWTLQTLDMSRLTKTAVFLITERPLINAM